jgi:hypothetical protein
MKRFALVLAFIAIAAFLVIGSLANPVHAARPTLDTGGGGEPEQSGAPAESAHPAAPNVVLVDQYNNDLGNGIVSANRTDSPPLSGEAADDFIVPAGETWQITQLDVRARIGFPNPASFNVVFYTDSATLPGTPVYTATNLAVGGTNPNFIIILTVPATLETGTYWVSVQGNIVGTNWYWQGRTVLDNNSTAWREGGAYGTGCTSWTRLTTCAGFSWPGQMFRLHGTINGGGTPTGTSIPTSTATSTATVIPIATNTQTSVPVATSTTAPTGTPASTSTATAVATSTATSTATVTACTITFSDVPADHTFYANIRCLACRGILGGYADGTFRPGNDITRGQIAKVVSNAAGLTGTPTGQTYTDVPATHTFYEWIERLSSLGVIGGYPCGGPGEPCDGENRPYFRPQNNATRGQLSKIVAEAAGVGGTPTGQTYADVLPEHPFYVWIERLTSLGVMGGYACGRPGEPCDGESRPYFRPQNNVTRGQASKIVANTFFLNCETLAGR